MQRIKCWAVREQFACGEDEIHYFTTRELAKEFYDFAYNDYVAGFSNIKEGEIDGGVYVLDGIGEFAYAITLYETVIKFHDEKFW